MQVLAIPCLSDNYAYLVVCPATKEAAVVDPSEAAPVLDALAGRTGARHEVKVTAILATHHHPDHVGGVAELADTLGVTAVYGHASETARIPRLSRPLAHGARFAVGRLAFEALHVPGHTTGAIAFVARADDGDPAVFTGDTLFVAGCGRLFEGTPAAMHASLARLAALEPRTKVYCGHEYTEANLRFAAALEPGNDAVTRARERAADVRRRGSPTVPSTIGEERATNPFLRTASPELRAVLGVSADAPDAEVFAAARARKDTFRG